jgi:hypothetical protein
MTWRTLHGRRGRLLGSALLAGLLAVAPAPAADRTDPTPLLVGAQAVRAQGGMDVGILLPSFYELPMAVNPGETFTIGASTAPGARCAGQLSFRNLPPIDLEAVAAPGGACAWTVTVPPTTRNGNGTIAIDISRNGQRWALYGVVYVRPVGESRY